MGIRWGILGLGVAGHARARAILEDPRCELIGAYRGRPSDLPIALMESEDDLLAQVDAVAVSSPDTCHPSQVKRALEMGKHVVCEFPVAGSADEAASLFELAKQQQRVLHVEHIERLTGTAERIRSEVARLGRLKSGHLVFEGRERPGFSVAHNQIARIHRLLDALGPPGAIRVSERTSQSMSAHCRYDQSIVELTIRAGPKFRRSTRFTLELEGGTLHMVNRTLALDGQPLTLPPSPGLFGTDHQWSMKRILTGEDGYLTEQQICEALAICDGLALSPVGEWVP